MCDTYDNHVEEGMEVFIHIEERIKMFIIMHPIL